MTYTVARYPVFFAVVLALVSTMPTTTHAQAKDPVPIYYFGIPPWQKGQSVDEIRNLYKPLLTWLGDKIGCKLNFTGADTYEEMITKLATGKVQLASLGAYEYVTAKDANPALKLLFTELKWNDDKTQMVDSYIGYILALKTRTDLNTLDDLKGERFSFVSTHSTSGYLFPSALLRQKGIVPDEFFGRVFFLGSHPRVTDAIVAGSIDAGATWDFNWNRATQKHGDVFKAVFTTPPIPNLAIVAHPSLPADIVAKIEEVLPTIDASLLVGLPAGGFVKRPDSFYGGVRALRQYIGR